jgi:hypothetical protein
MALMSSGYSRAALSESALTDQEQPEPALLAIRQPRGGPAGAGEAVRSGRHQASPRPSSSEELDLGGRGLMDGTRTVASDGREAVAREGREAAAPRRAGRWD